MSLPTSLIPLTDEGPTAAIARSRLIFRVSEWEGRLGREEGRRSGSLAGIFVAGWRTCLTCYLSVSLLCTHIWTQCQKTGTYSVKHPQHGIKPIILNTPHNSPQWCFSFNLSLGRFGLFNLSPDHHRIFMLQSFLLFGRVGIRIGR
jgi:hypothetical protein